MSENKASILNQQVKRFRARVEWPTSGGTAYGADLSYRTTLEGTRSALLGMVGRAPDDWPDPTGLFVDLGRPAPASYVAKWLWTPIEELIEGTWVPTPEALTKARDLKHDAERMKAFALALTEIDFID